MAKFYGNIGFVRTVPTKPGVWKNEAVERKYRGDITRDVRKWESGGKLNDNIAVDNTISIIADSYMYNNAYAIRYVKMMGSAWRVSRVEQRHPRLILYLGGIYNGEQAGSSE